MSKTKKILAIVLALAVALALSCTAFAGTITIQNGSAGETYHAYKVFDSDTATIGNDTVTYYTYDGSNATFLAAIQASNSPFVVSPNANNGYNVSLKSGSSSDDVAAFLKNNVANLGSAVATATPQADGTVALTVSDPGYYYVDSSLGTVVTLDSYASNITVLDKNQKPGPGPDDPSDPTSGSHYKQIVDDNGDYVDQAASYDYGTVVYFKLSCQATNYDGETQINEYVAHDVLGAGFSGFAIDSVVVTDGTGAHTLSSGDYTYSSANGTVSIPWTSSGASIYTSNATIEVYCHATMDDSGDNYTNTGYFTWTGSPSAPDPTDPDAPVPDEVEVFTRDITVVAQDATDNTIKLEGTYALKNSDGDYYAYDSTTGEVTWVDDIADATTVTTDPSDPTAAVFEGVADGTYSVEEVATPEGYNPLTAPQSVTANGADATATINYSRGAALPSTGAAGTIALIGIGSLLALAAGMFLVTNARMKKEDILG